MTGGWVYVLVNPSMPGVVKVGMTTGTPERRARELSAATGVPRPFSVASAVRVRDPRGVEAAAHRALDARRVNRRREFFRASPAEAERAVRRAAGLGPAWLRPALEALALLSAAAAAAAAFPSPVL